MKLKVQMEVGWLPVRDQDPDVATFKAVLVQDREFLRTPQAGEFVKIADEFYKVSQFFHDTDAACMTVCLSAEWAHTPDDAKARIGKLKADGWQVANGQA